MTTPIPASELTTGMTITACDAQPDLVGWNVTEATPTRVRTHPVQDAMLLILERGEMGISITHEPTWDTETRSAWLRADEQVEVET